ncbi:enolase C-terminal domain-like protein [Agromyces sp. LHK192]|uniref:enolase C-terminal domain-like protein n=1 Tax=Agromyces sp. LHK192 TaxID=2498704 RepID=UPI000FDBEC91|nr:enolase C-terminal domain-like protein [Agromyces sp. LHK192]
MTETRAPWADRDGVRITRVRPIVTAPEGVALVVVRIETSEAGLVGYGCATFAQQYAAVARLVVHLAPLIVGRSPADRGDIARMLHHSGYWRDGPVGNSAISGIDQALWDLAGKRAGMPVYELLGGRVRDSAPIYLHAGGDTIEETLDEARAILSSGVRHVRIQSRQPGFGSYGTPRRGGGYPGTPNPDGWDPRHYLRATPELFRRAREELGGDVELLHDVHSRLSVREARTLADDLAFARPYFLEDPVPPDQYDRLPELGASSPVPIAVGELFTSATAAAGAVRRGGIDFLRVHVSAIGGLTPAVRLNALCELEGVRTAWHAPADVSPFGAAANVALDVSSTAFGIQEGHVYPDQVLDVFPGTLQPAAGFLAPSPEPGWGIGLDERAAARHEPQPYAHERWAAQVRRPDGFLESP